MVVIANAHNELIHDAVLDYYGKRLATCSSDKTIKIFEVEGETHKLIDTLTGHEGQFGVLIGHILNSEPFWHRVLMMVKC